MIKKTDKDNSENTSDENLDTKKVEEEKANFNPIIFQILKHLVLFFF